MSGSAVLDRRVEAWPGEARSGRAVADRQRSVSRGWDWQSWKVWVVSGMKWYVSGTAVVARLGLAPLGTYRSGSQGKASRGMACTGSKGQSWRGWDRLGPDRQGMAVMDGLGKDRPGPEWQSWMGPAAFVWWRHGAVSSGMAVMERRVKLSRGLAVRATAGMKISKGVRKHDIQRN